MKKTTLLPLAGQSLKVFGWLMVTLLAVQFVLGHTQRALGAALVGFDELAEPFLSFLWVALPALFLGPFLVWGTWCPRYRRAHRWGERVYLLSVVGGSLSEIYLALTGDAGFAARIGLGTMAGVWLTTALVACASRQRKWGHQAWMLRSYVITFGLVTAQLWMEWTASLNVPFEARFTTMAWVCWAPLLFLAELGLFLRYRYASPPRAESPLEYEAYPDR